MDSFADLLTTKDYLVYNSGIVGADLPQYNKIAEKYIAILKPDVVVVNVFAGNDFSKHDRIPQANVPIYYPTNAGNLYSCPQGIYFYSAQEAYDHIVNMSRIPTNTMFNKVMTKTRISTLLWSFLAEKNIVKNKLTEESKRYWEEVNQKEIGYSINRKYLESIKGICDTNNSKLIVSIIPKYDNIEENVDKYLDGFNYDEISSIKKSDYSEDRHFNEKGHAKYAEYLNGLLINLDD